MVPVYLGSAASAARCSRKVVVVEAEPRLDTTPPLLLRLRVGTEAAAVLEAAPCCTAVATAGRSSSCFKVEAMVCWVVEKLIDLLET